MSGRAIGALLGCAAWLTAGAALAQREPPRVQLLPTPPAPEAAQATPVSPVAVEATTPAELKKQTYSYVQTFGATTAKFDQLARWSRPICVTVQGLTPDKAALVKARVEETAKALKVGALGPGCNPTVELMFADQPQAVLDRVAERRPDVLGYDWRRQASVLKTVSHPIQSWYVTSTEGDSAGGGMAFMNLGDNGAPVASLPGVAGRQQNGTVIDDPDERAPSCAVNSRVTSCLKSMFEHVLVVVDNGKVQGYDLGFIADYATVLALSQPRSLDGCNVLPSVIDVFARGCAGRDNPAGLTRADAAYLIALYKADLRARKTSEQTDIAGRMADALLNSRTPDALAIPVKTNAPR